MILTKKIIYELYQLRRKSDYDSFIKVYEECKQYLLEIEEKQNIKPSYLSKEAHLKREIEEEYKQCIKMRDDEIKTLSNQIDSMKIIEEKFNELNNNFKKLESLSKQKDKMIKQLESKIKQAEVIPQSA